ncbi:4-(cytidine 5'-diphospho)-2-C-methyl-D-erythritol kinase [Candidatus Omnitrophota bacterium]
MNSITLKAPAKVNLFLKVLKKRRDGFHEILTLFERIGLFDIIKIKRLKKKGIRVTSDKYIVRNTRANLAYKAARILMDHCGVDEGLHIHIKKNIPIGSGLGGGSSDAAAVFKGVNTLLGLRVSGAALLKLSRQIGSDIGFFTIDRRFAIGKGKGDTLRSINIYRKLWHLLIVPDFKCPTKDIYNALDLTLTKHTAGVKINCFKKLKAGTGGLIDMLHNDLQRSVIEKRQKVGRIIERLASSCGCKAIISGSGPSVFCLFGNRKEAIRARDRFLGCLPARRTMKGWRIFVVSTA